MPSTRSSKAGAKRRLVLDDDVVADPPKSKSASTAVSPKNHAVNTILETPQKRRRGNDDHHRENSVQTKLFSPVGKVAVVTPPKEDKKAEKDSAASASAAYVPTYIHKNLSYQRKGGASLTETAKKTFELIEMNFVIPDDFEQNRQYGPLSGTCHEERVIRAYNLNLIEAKQGTEIEICSSCATLGHKRVDCPDLV